MGYTSFTHFLGRVVDNTVDPGATKRFLDRAANYRGGKEAFEGIAEGFGEAIEGLARGTVRRLDDDGFTWLKIQDIATSSGFKIKELDQAYRRWAKDQFDRWKDLPEADRLRESPLDLRPEVYAEKCSHGRPRAILDALMGPNPVKSSRPGIRVSQEAMWPSVFFRRLAVRIRGNIAGKMAREMSSPAKVRTLVEKVVRERYHIAAGNAVDATEELSLLGNYLSRYKHDLEMDAWRARGSPAGEMPEMPTWNSGDGLNDLFDGMSDADLEKVLGGIIGNQKINAEEFIHRVLDAQVILDDITIAADYRGVQSLWDIPGFHKMLGNVVSRSGYEKGLVFEIEQIIKLRKAHPDAKIILQVNIPPNSAFSGPDIVLIKTLADGSEVAEICQAKSVHSLAAMTGYTGAMFKQTQTDIQRLFKNYGEHWIDGWPYIQLPDGSFVKVSNKWVFQADYLMMRDAEEVVEKLKSLTRENESFDPDAVMGILQETMDDTAAKWRGLAENTNSISSLPEEGLTDLIGRGGSRTGKLQEYIDLAVAEGREVSVKEVYFAKMAMDGDGVIDPVLVQRLVNMNPPILIEGELIMTETDMFTFWREAG